MTGTAGVPAPAAALLKASGPYSRSVLLLKENKVTEQIPLFDDLPVYVGRVKKHPAHTVWRTMIQRCYNPNASNFARYGKCGVRVCDEWRKSSRAFIAWAIKAGYKPGLQIDRKNNARGYSPGNCHFVTRRENINNRRNTLRLPDGSVFVDAVRVSGLNYDTVRMRLRLGWPVSDALSIPVGGKRPLPDGFQSVGDAAARVVAATVAAALAESEAASQGDKAQRSAARRKPKAKRKGRAPVIPSGLVDLPSPDLKSPSYGPGYPAAWLAKDKGHA